MVALAASLAIGSATAQNTYGIPTEIQEGNILHCFDWRLTDITNELPNIAEAGFGSIQISPMQSLAKTGYNWSDLYRPYDFAFFPSCGIGTSQQLKTLCQEAEKYGIKIIVDVVFNHVDRGSNHIGWWNTNDRLRNTTSMINYSNRNSITHDLLGDYPEVNTENPEVIERAKNYLEELKKCGVKGIRFDAAKHIGLPSEGSDFWKEVTAVDGLFYYGEILDGPGGGNSNNLLKEYVQYMGVADNVYSDNVRRNLGVPTTSANWGGNLFDENLCVYWGESHDTYANAGGASKNASQGNIDRAYAAVASRNKPTALYFSRPNYKEFGDIKVGQKGSTHFMDPEVAEVNKFRNVMIGKADCYTFGNLASSITRENGGAVIIKKGSAGSVTIANGNGYCPAGTYYDRVSGNEFTVTETTITGIVGDTGIAVIYNDDSGVEYIPEAVDNAETEWYTLQGLKIDRPTEPGIYIARGGNGKATKYVIR